MAEKVPKSTSADFADSSFVFWNSHSKDSGGCSCSRCLMGCGCFAALCIVIVAIAFGASYLGDHKITLTPMSTHKISVDTKFNRGITLEDSSRHSSLYLYNTLPPLDLVFNDYVNQSVEIAVNSYESWAWNLKPGSNVTIETCAEDGITFYMFFGKDQFDDWANDGSQSWEFEDVITGECDLPDNPNGQYYLQVNDSNDYYFVYENPGNVAPSNVLFEMWLYRTEYNTSDGYVSVCTPDPRCTVYLDFDSDQFAMVQSDSSSDTDETYDMTWESVPNIAFYFILFATMAGFFLIICPCIVWVCSYRQRSTIVRDGYSSLKADQSHSFSSTAPIARTLPPSNSFSNSSPFRVAQPPDTPINAGFLK